MERTELLAKNVKTEMMTLISTPSQRFALGTFAKRRHVVALRAYHPPYPSAAENQALLRELENRLKDPENVKQLSTLLSSSTTRNISKALWILQAQQQKALGGGAAKPQEIAAALQEVTADIQATQATTTTAPAAPVSFQDLKFVALQHGLPFVGFGFVDNAIMILAGDYIDLTLGVSLGISSMAAAGIGNTISDIAGLGLGNIVEDICARMGLPNPMLTPEQLMLKETRMAKVFGSAVGVTIGCLLGMLPLLFLETREDQGKQKQTNSSSTDSREI